MAMALDEAQRKQRDEMERQHRIAVERGDWDRADELECRLESLTGHTYPRARAANSWLVVGVVWVVVETEVDEPSDEVQRKLFELVAVLATDREAFEDEVSKGWLASFQRSPGAVAEGLWVGPDLVFGASVKGCPSTPCSTTARARASSSTTVQADTSSTRATKRS